MQRLTVLIIERALMQSKFAAGFVVYSYDCKRICFTGPLMAAELEKALRRRAQRRASAIKPLLNLLRYKYTALQSNTE